MKEDSFQHLKAGFFSFNQESVIYFNRDLNLSFNHCWREKKSLHTIWFCFSCRCSPAQAHYVIMKITFFKKKFI